MENTDNQVKKEAPGVTGSQQITDKNGNQMNLKDGRLTSPKVDELKELGDEAPKEVGDGGPKGSTDTVQSDLVYGSDKTPTRKEKEQSKEDTAGSNLPGHQNPGKPLGMKGDLGTPEE